MSQQPYNVCPTAPTNVTSEWQAAALLWTALYREVGGSSHFSPLTIKARYVTGVMLATCRSVTILLGERQLIETTFYPAYIVFASAVELLGRCIRGNASVKGTTADLEAGLQWLASPNTPGLNTPGQQVSPDRVLVATTNYTYTIKELIALRNYSAHGQGVLKSAGMPELLALHNVANSAAQGQAAQQPAIKDFDYLILGEMPTLLGNGVEAYLTALWSSEELANNLAHAAVTPFRNRPILDSMWNFPADEAVYPASIGSAFRAMDWTYKPSNRF
jgi:hypothetical protein